MKELTFTFTILFDKSKSIFSEGFEYCADQFKLSLANSESQIAMLSFARNSPVMGDIFTENELSSLPNSEEITYPSNVLKGKESKVEENFTQCLDAKALFNYKAEGKEKARFFCSLDEALNEYSKSLKDHFQCANDFIEKSISYFSQNGFSSLSDLQYFTRNCSTKHLVVLGDIHPNLVTPYVHLLKNNGLLDESFTLGSGSYSVLNPKCEIISIENAIVETDFECRDRGNDMVAASDLHEDFWVTVEGIDREQQNKCSKNVQNIEERGLENTKNTGELADFNHIKPPETLNLDELPSYE